MCKQGTIRWICVRYGATHLVCIIILVGMFAFLTSCGVYSHGFSGQLLLRDESSKLIMVDSSGKVNAKYDLQVIDAKWSPDGQRVVFWNQNGNLGILELETGQQTEITNQMPSHAQSLGWSPDGQEIAFATQSPDDNLYRLYVTNVTNVLDPHLVWTTKYECGIAKWLSDGTHIIIYEELPVKDSHLSSRVVRVNSYTGESNELFSLDDGIQVMSWSPDEMRVAISSPNKGVFIRGENGKEQLIAADSAGGLTWSSDGKSLAFNQVVVDSNLRLVVNVYQVETGKTFRLYPSTGWLAKSSETTAYYILDWRE